MGYELSASS